MKSNDLGSKRTHSEVTVEVPEWVESEPERRKRRSGIREVADRAGVGVSSVSRVLSGHPDTSESMRRRVLSAAEDLGYKPNFLARSLRRKETLSVGFVVGDISNPLLAKIVKGADTVLREAGYSMLLTNSDWNANLDEDHVRLLERRQVDGLLLSTATEDHEPTIQLLNKLDVPLVAIERDLPESTHASFALSDHEIGMGAAIDHLLQLGHRRIGMIVGQPVRPSTERRRVLERAFEERGLPKTYEVLGGSFSIEHGAEATRSLLNLPEPPTAIIAGGNQLLVGSLEVITKFDLELGRDLSLVSCDDVPLSSLYRPPIAVVHRDTRELGRVAAELLLRRIQGDGEPGSRVVLPTEFIPRPSCGPPSG